MSTNKEGKTVVPADERVAIEQMMECPGDNAGRRFKHAWKWRWVNGVWTDEVQCLTCGAIESRVRT